jgi:K+-transporting ATPase ATPase B chain
MTIHRPEALSLFDGAILAQAGKDSMIKLDPRQLVRNPVMFTTALVAVLATILTLRDAASGGAQTGIMVQISVWLWFTVIFANFAEAIAEGRGKAQAASLRRTKSEAVAKRVSSVESAGHEVVPAASLRSGDLVVCEAGDSIPGDGDVVAGIATVDESAITGESAPVIRESGGDRSAVTGGTRVVSDRIVVKITANPGESFLDRMISLVEGAKRQKTPNEIALTILLVGMTMIFLIVVATLPAWASWSGTAIPAVFLAALFITLIPTTIGGLLSAIGIAGMDRLVKFNVIAKSGRAVEAAGDIDVLLLDKTGTITLGARQASEFLALADINERDLAEAAFLSSLADETPEGKSIIALARARFQFKEPDRAHMVFIPFTAQTRMSGVDLPLAKIRKGASDAIIAHVAECSGTTPGGVPKDLVQLVERVAKAGGTPLVVARDGRPLGVIHLKDIVKPGIRERFPEP